MTSEDKTRIYVANRFAPGVRLNDTYQLDELIASGGMGQVFRGHNIETDEPVAIKTILSELADDDTIFALFKKEGLILGRLNHPTIVRYYAFSRDPKIGRQYLVMEYVEGQSLAERMRPGPMPIEDVYQLFARVAEGLSLAHKAGVVHRDLSPDNIILQHSSVAEPKVIDFGIAHAANSSATMLGSSFAGKFSFVSPEQIGLADKQVTNRSDIYSLGLVMVAALRGKPLNMGTMPADVMERRRSVPDLAEIDAGIRPLIEQMLQPEATNRPESMGYIADWLAQAGGLSLKTSRLDTERTAPWMPAAGGERFVAHVTPILPGQPTSSPQQPAGATAPVNLPGSETYRRSRLPLITGIVTIVGTLILAAYLTGWIRIGEQSGWARIMVGNNGQDSGVTPGPPTQQPSQEPAPATAENPGTDVAVREPSLETLPRAPPPAVPASPGSPDADTTNPPPTSDAASPPVDAARTAEQSSPVEPDPQDAREATDASPPQPSNQTAETTDADKPSPEPVSPTTPPVENNAMADTAKPAAPDGPLTKQLAPESAPNEMTAAEDPQEQLALNSPRKVTTKPETSEPAIDPEDCYFAAIKAQSDDAMAIKGIGLSLEPFIRIKSALAASGSASADMNSHLITAQQCPATAFLKAIHDTTADNPDLSFTDPGTQHGDKVAGVFNNVGSRLLRVFMIDGKGRIFDLQSDTIVTNSPPLFNVSLDAGRSDFTAPGLIVAVASAQQIDLGPARTAADLPALAEQLLARGDVTGIDFGFFSYGTVLETVAQ